MNWETFYLVCFGVGLVLSVVSVVGGSAHFHLGHMFHGAHGAHAGGNAGHWLSAINGLTVTAFLCWFGAAGYLLNKYTPLVALFVLAASIVSGIAGALILWTLLFRVLLPRERVLTLEETEMSGVVARVSDQIREEGGIGEIIFSQAGSRRSAAARSEDGKAIVRGAEVVVLRYEHGIAYVRAWEEFANHLP